MNICVQHTNKKAYQNTHKKTILHTLIRIKTNKNMMNLTSINGYIENGYGVFCVLNADFSLCEKSAKLINHKVGSYPSDLVPVTLPRPENQTTIVFQDFRNFRKLQNLDFHRTLQIIIHPFTRYPFPDVRMKHM
jgi:hypothetical protein